MKNFIFGACMAVLPFLPAGAHAEPKKPPVYRVVRVDPPAPYPYLYADGANDRGHFYGTIADDVHFEMVFWTPEAGLTVLTVPSGQITGFGGINDADEIAVNATSGPWVWSPSAGWRPFQSDAAAETTQITSRSDRGEMVGVAFDQTADFQVVHRRAVKWRHDGRLVEMRPKRQAVPAAINEHGNVALTVFETNRFGGVDQEAVLAAHGDGNRPLGFLPDTERGHTSTAAGLSENGVVALNSLDYLGRSVACFWTADGGIRPIQAVDAQSSTALGMSRRGTMLGQQRPGSNAFVWNEAWGIRLLADRLSLRYEPLRAFFASRISGGGVISGYEYTGVLGFESSRAVVLLPDVVE